MSGDTSSQAAPQYRPSAPRLGRPVVDQHGVVHRSCIRACVAHNLNPTAGYFRALMQKDGWRFLDEAPRQPASPSSTPEE